MRRFYAQFTVVVDVDDRLFKSVLTDEWRKTMYDFYSREDVAGHIAFNMMRGCSLNDIDGYCDQPKGRAKLIEIQSGDVEESNE